MPTYEYRCKDCGEELEVQQSFHDDPLTECPACGGDLRKRFGAVGISFKGSGFYKTDSRGGSGRSSGGDGGSSTGTSGGDAPAAGSSGSSGSDAAGSGASTSASAASTSD